MPTERKRMYLKNETMEVSEAPENRKAIRTKWFFDLNFDPNNMTERFKALLVEKGFGKKAEVFYFEFFPISFQVCNCKI